MALPTKHIRNQGPVIAMLGHTAFEALRRKVTGYDGIEMQKADATDRDGKACKPGRYRLSTEGRKRAAGWLSGKEAA